MPLQTRRSGNPAFNAFARVPRVGFGVEAMTLEGTVNKSFLLLVVLMACALWPWSQAVAGNLQAVGGEMMLGLIGGFILALIVSFKPTTAPYLAVPYAALEGLVLGGISAQFNLRYPGIAIEAVAATFAVAFVMLVLYRTRVIRVTDRFRHMVVGATLGIVLLYAASWILGFFHVAVPFINGSGPLGIGFSVVVVGIAAFNLALDFDMIEQGAAGGAPKFMEWYGAFALMVTLVWMYLEMLRLLAKIQRQ